ncbi:hypothetical protein [Streptomyces sp. YIM 98790]|uniref:hypothetical protein n=1 Tax=Streptomyces sp. YIM 98790 TaxID=2689077 RepID=UPI0037DD0AF2
MAAEFTAELAGNVLAQTCRAAGLDPSGAELLRLGSNAVYRLASAPVIVRIARDPGSLEPMSRSEAKAVTAPICVVFSPPASRRLYYGKR